MKNLKLKIRTLIAVIWVIMGLSPNQLLAGEIISAKIVGEGTPMILLHGMACSSEVWEDVVDYYQPNYELHVISIAGFGNKDSFTSEHLLETVRDELINYIQDNELVRPILMGHSMGGFLSLWIASVAPDLVGKVVSIDGVPYFPVLQMPGITPETAKAMVNQISSSMKNMSEEAFRANQEMMINSMIATESKRADVVEMGIRSNSDVISKAFGEMYLTDLRNEVSNITAPVLVLGSWYGYRHYGVTKESCEAGYKSQLASVKNAQVKLAETALHFIFFDEPEWFYTQVDNFLRGNS